MKRTAALFLVLWLAISVGTWAHDGDDEDNDSVSSKPGESAKRVALAQKFMKGALYKIEKDQISKAEELVKGALQALHQDSALKDKVDKVEDCLEEAIKMLGKDKAEEAKEEIEEAIKSLEDDEDKDEGKSERVRYLEKKKVATGAVKILLVENFVKQALTLLKEHQTAKAEEVVKAIKQYVAQSKEIKDKDGAAQKMIDDALSFLAANSTAEALELLEDVEKQFEDDEDVQEAAHAFVQAKGKKLLEEAKVRRGTEKAFFVAEFLAAALTYLRENKIEQAKEVIEGVETYVGDDESLKKKGVGAIHGALTYLEQDNVEQAIAIIIGAVRELEKDEDYKEAAQFWHAVGGAGEVKTKGTSHGVQYLEKEKDKEEKVTTGTVKILLVENLVKEAITFLKEDHTEKATEIVKAIKLYVAQCKEITDKEGAAKKMIDEALDSLQNNSIDKAQKFLENAEKKFQEDDDIQEAAHVITQGQARGKKLLEKEKVLKGTIKFCIAAEFVAAALFYLHEKKIEQAREVIEGIKTYVDNDESLKKKAVGGVAAVLVYLQQNNVEKAEGILEAVLTDLEKDEDFKQAAQFWQGVEDRAKAHGVTGSAEGKSGLILLHEFIHATLVVLEKPEPEKAREMVQACIMYLLQDPALNQETPELEGFFKEAMMALEQKNVPEALEQMNGALAYIEKKEKPNSDKEL